MAMNKQHRKIIRYCGYCTAMWMRTLNDQRTVNSLNAVQIPIKTHEKLFFLEFNWSFIT